MMRAATTKTGSALTRLGASARMLAPYPRPYNPLRDNTSNFAFFLLGQVLAGTGGFVNRLKTVAVAGLISALVIVIVAYYAEFPIAVAAGCVYAVSVALFVVSCLRAGENALGQSFLGTVIWPVEIAVIGGLAFNLGGRLTPASFWVAALAVAGVGSYALAQLLSLLVYRRRETADGASAAPLPLQERRQAIKNAPAGHAPSAVACELADELEQEQQLQQAREQEETRRARAGQLEREQQQEEAAELVREQALAIAEEQAREREEETERAREHAQSLDLVKALDLAEVEEQEQTGAQVRAQAQAEAQATTDREWVELVSGPQHGGTGEPRGARDSQ